MVIMAITKITYIIFAVLQFLLCELINWIVVSDEKRSVFTIILLALNIICLLFLMKKYFWFAKISLGFDTILSIILLFIIYYSQIDWLKVSVIESLIYLFSFFTASIYLLRKKNIF